MSIGQIYLFDNLLLKRRLLMLADVKHILLGHWGTTPGKISFMFTGGCVERLHRTISGKAGRISKGERAKTSSG